MGPPLRYFRREGRRGGYHLSPSLVILERQYIPGRLSILSSFVNSVQLFHNKRKHHSPNKALPTFHTPHTGSSSIGNMFVRNLAWWPIHTCTAVQSFCPFLHSHSSSSTHVVSLHAMFQGIKPVGFSPLRWSLAHWTLSLFAIPTSSSKRFATNPKKKKSPYLTLFLFVTPFLHPTHCCFCCPRTDEISSLRASSKNETQWLLQPPPL